MKKKILFNGLGNRGWIGGLYYIKNIMFSCLQNENIMERFSLVLLIDPEHADIFDCFKEMTPKTMRRQRWSPLA